MVSYTTNLALIKPAEGEKALVSQLNANMDTIDAELASQMRNVPPGTVTMWAGQANVLSATGWLVCDGQAVSRSTYADLYAAIGTTYGTGDGSTTFNLPNLKGRIPVGYDDSQTEFNTRGKTGGAKTTTLAIANIPSHTHTMDHDHASTTTSAYSQVGVVRTTPTSSLYLPTAGSQAVTYNDVNHTHTVDMPTFTGSTGAAGSASPTAISKLAPYIALQFIIRY